MSGVTGPNPSKDLPNQQGVLPINRLKPCMLHIAATGHPECFPEYPEHPDSLTTLKQNAHYFFFKALDARCDLGEPFVVVIFCRLEFAHLPRIFRQTWAVSTIVLRNLEAAGGGRRWPPVRALMIMLGACSDGHPVPVI